MRVSYAEFCELAFAATHQRQVIYEAVVAAPGHYSPEQT